MARIFRVSVGVDLVENGEKVGWTDWDLKYEGFDKGLADKTYDELKKVYGGVHEVRKTSSYMPSAGKDRCYICKEKLSMDEYTGVYYCKNCTK